MMLEAMDIATVVRQAAKDAGVSRADLAVAAGVSNTTMARRLIGSGSPFFVHELAGIAGLLGLTVHELALRAEDRAAERQR